MTASVVAGSWVLRAACRPGFDRLPVAEALTVCARCPVVSECRAWARACRYDGVAGGAFFADGVATTGSAARVCAECGGLLARGARWDSRYCTAPPCQRAAKRAHYHRTKSTDSRGTTHGTAAGARWHYRYNQPLCDPCKQAEHRARVDAYAKRKAAS